MTANTEHVPVKSFQPPDRNIKIWRYMDMPKLLAFLQTESLYFARADTLDDPYEGSWTKLNRLAGVQQIQEAIRDGLMHPADAEKYTPEVTRKSFAFWTRVGRENTYINSWHASETENAAMWKLYGTSTGSIAIQSTYQTLVDAIPDHSPVPEGFTTSVHMGMVQYKDYNSDEDYIPGGNPIFPFMHKRKEFEHEKEVRAIIVPSKKSHNPRGIKVPIDITASVETVRVQPSTPAWVRDAIESLIEKYGWGMKVMPSQIDIEPMY